MRRVRTTMFVAAALTLALAGVASALSYRTGTYTAGNPAKGAGVQMKVGHGSFSVQVIRYLETCSYGSRNQVDYFTFRSGTRASLTGRVAKNGDFSGRYSASSGAASVSGHVQGGRATITGSEHGPYNPASTVQPNSCHGSHTFHATLKAG